MIILWWFSFLSGLENYPTQAHHMSRIFNDKYYTPPDIANICIDNAIAVIGKGKITEVVDPCVGSGAFLNHPFLVPSLAYDIAPECDSSDVTKVIQADFLALNLPHKAGRLIIGNPPFDNRGNLARKFFKASVAIADYIAFILPINQLSNSHSMFEFNLSSSVDLGVQCYSGHPLHCCFNVNTRPPGGILNPQPRARLPTITIYRHDAFAYSALPYDLRMCYWGASAGRILSADEHCAAEYKIKVNEPLIKTQVIELISTYDWSQHLSISMKSISKSLLLDVICQHLNLYNKHKNENNKLSN